ncbi:hypothetical protein PG997_003533 [Apiospora hydei]|uniref:Uncharacterized protein n=1 Tax=Apiospora hydei TaxID=1337664 RepID=A0ABR1WZJ9_9PEZI
MPGGKTKHVLGANGLFSSQPKATGNSSRASSAVSDEDEAIMGYAEDDPASQNSQWRPEAVSSPRSASSRSNANRTKDQLPTEQVIREEDFSDDAGASITSGKTPNASRQSRGQDQSSADASESDIHENLIESEELDFSDDINGTKSEESAKSFGDEEYIPSQRSAGTCSQKALGGPARGVKQNSVRTGSVHSSKGGDHASAERVTTDESETFQATSAGRTTRVMPSKRRVAKKPFPSDNDDGNDASPSKAHTAISATTGSKVGVKDKNVPEAQTRRITQKGSNSVNPDDPFEIEGSPEPDTKQAPPAGRSRKTTNPRANSNSKPTVKSSREIMSDDIEDDDEPPLSLNASVTKPNSKKRRSSPQGYGSRPKKPKGPESNFLFGDRDSITVQPNSKARTDPKQFSPGQNVDHIEISSDAPSSDEAVEHLQLEIANSAEPAAQQKKQQLAANDSFTVNNSLEAPTRKPKEANTSSYTLPVSPPHQLNAPSHSGNDSFIVNAANYDSIVKAPSRIRAVPTVHRTGGRNKDTKAQQNHSLVRSGKDAIRVPENEDSSTMLSAPLSRDKTSNDLDPFADPRNSEEDKGAPNRLPPSQSVRDTISYGSRPQKAAAAVVVQADPSKDNYADANRWDSRATQRAAARPTQLSSAYLQSRSNHVTHPYGYNPLGQRIQRQHENINAGNVHARSSHSESKQDFSAQLNPKTQEYSHRFAAMQSLRRDNTQTQPFMPSPRRENSPGRLNVTSTEFISPEIQDQLGRRSRQNNQGFENNADGIQPRTSTEKIRTRCDDLVDGASEGIAAMLHDVVTAIHRQLAPKQDIIQDVVREYDRGGSKLTATLLKRQRGEFEPTVNTFHGSFQTMSKTFARAAQGIEAEGNAATRKTEAFENSYKKRKQHMCKLRESIRENLTGPGTV